MKKFLSIVLTISLLLGISVLYPCTVSAAAKTFNNVTSATYGNYIYYSNLDNNCIYRMTKSGKNNKKIANSDISYFSIYNNRIYYGKNNKIYSVKLNGKNKKKLNVPNDSKIACFYGKYVFYSVKQNLYKKNLVNGKSKHVMNCGDYPNIFLCGEYLLINVPNPNYLILYTYNIKNQKATTLTYKRINNSDYDYYTTHNYVVKNIVKKGNTVYFTVGYIQGSGSFYTGDFYKININGKGCKKLVSNCGPSFYIKGKTIYLDKSFDGYGLNGGCIKLNTSGKIIKNYNYSYTVHGCSGKYIFFTKKNSKHLYYGTSLSSKKVAVKGKSKHSNYFEKITTQGKYLFLRAGINTYTDAIDNAHMLAKTFKFVKKKL